jgi:preprotein translocase subunit SecA
MNFNSILKSLFGDKSSRDMKAIQPLVEKAKSFTAQVEALSNDELRARTKAIQQQVQL